MEILSVINNWRSSILFARKWARERFNLRIIRLQISWIALTLNNPIYLLTHPNYPRSSRPCRYHNPVKLTLNLSPSCEANPSAKWASHFHPPLFWVPQRPNWASIRVSQNRSDPRMLLSLPQNKALISRTKKKSFCNLGPFHLSTILAAMWEDISSEILMRMYLTRPSVTRY